MKRKKEMEAPNSIYYATGNAIKEEGIRDETVPQTPKKERGYDTALSILARIRWGP